MTTSTIPQVLRERVKRLRLDAGLTTRQLAEMMSISQSKVSYVENGKTPVTCQYLGKIQTALGLSTGQVLCGQGWFDPEGIPQYFEKAKEVAFFSNMLIPLPLQTKDYMLALASEFYGRSPADARERSDYKFSLIESLSNSKVRIIVTEASLKTFVRSELVLRDQVSKVRECDKFEIRVIPEDTPLNASPLHHIIIFDHKLVSSETIFGDVFSLDSARAVSAFKAMWSNGLSLDQADHIFDRVMGQIDLYQD